MLNLAVIKFARVSNNIDPDQYDPLAKGLI